MFGFFSFHSFLINLGLVVVVSAEVRNLGVHRRDVCRQRFPVVFKFLESDLQLSSFVIPFVNFFFGCGDVDLANLILLLKVDDEFILALDDGFVFINHLFGLLLLALGVSIHLCAHVVQCMQLFVQTSDFVVFDDDQLIQLVDLFLGVARLAFIAFEHSKETVHTFVARLTQVLHDSLTHLHLLFVVFELGSDFLGVAHQVFDVFLLSDISMLDFFNILPSDVNSGLLENSFVLSL